MPIIDEATEKQGVQYYHDIFVFFKKGMESEHFVDMNPQLMTELVHGNISKLVGLEIAGKLEVNSQVLKSAMEFSWRAIKKHS